MTDAHLLTFACMISFITCISGYLIMRRSFSEADSRAEPIQERVSQLPMQFSASQRRSTIMEPAPIHGERQPTKLDAASTAQPPVDRRWLH